MRPLTLSVEKSRELDRRAIEEYGLPSFLLMENAGRALAAHIEKVLQQFPRTTLLNFICGGGNNGGDGFVAARHIYLKHPNVRIYMMADPKTLKGDALLNFNIFKKLHDHIYPYSQFEQDKKTIFQKTPMVIVDCMLGTGLKGSVEGNYLSAIREINYLKKFHNGKVVVIAADIPSGLSGDEGPLTADNIIADVTVTFGSIKKGLADGRSKPYVGKLEVADIGLPEPLLKTFCV